MGGMGSMGVARGKMAQLAPRPMLMRLPARKAGADSGPADRFRGARLEERKRESLEKRLQSLEKDGKSDAEKKPVVEELLKLKLAPELHGLAEKVAKQGTAGNLTVGKIRVKAGRVEIRVQLTSLDDDVIKKLKKLGFKKLAEAKSVKLLIGTINVKQLEALAKLPEVRRVTPSL